MLKWNYYNNNKQGDKSTDMTNNNLPVIITSQKTIQISSATTQ